MLPGTLPTGATSDPIFQNMSTLNHKSDVIISMVGNMDPTVITQSLSFLLGSFAALAFVIASHNRY